MKNEGKRFSRRSFLKSGAAALGGLLAGPIIMAGCKNPNDHLITPEEVEKEKNQPISSDWLGKPPEVPEGSITVDEVCGIMNQNPKWADGLPLASAGYTGLWYYKD